MKRKRSASQKSAANYGGPSLPMLNTNNVADGHTIIEIAVPGPKVGLVIGKGWKTIHNLQKRAGVKMVLIQDGSKQTATAKPLRIIGEPNKCEFAKQLVMALITEEELEKNPKRTKQETHPVDSVVIDAEKVAIDLLSTSLYHCGSMHFSDLITISQSMCEETMRYFMNKTLVETIFFMENYPLLFDVEDFRFSAKTDSDAIFFNLNSTDSKVAITMNAFLHSLCCTEGCYRLSTIDCLLNCCSAVSSFLIDLQSGDPLEYFKGNCNFIISNEGNVQAWFMCKFKTDQNKAFGGRKLKNVSKLLLGNLRKIMKETKCESIHIMFLINSLAGNKKLHDFFLGLTNRELFWFFRSKPLFFIVSSGYMMPCRKAWKKVTPYFTSLLKGKDKIHYLDLVKELKSSSLSVSNFFDFHTELRVLKFFLMQPKYFLLDCDLHVFDSTDPKKRSQFYIPSIKSSDFDVVQRHDFTEEKIVEILLSQLGFKKMLYTKLLQKAFRLFPHLLLFFDSYTEVQEHQFFNSHRNFFHMCGQHVVCVARNISESGSSKMLTKCVENSPSLQKTSPLIDAMGSKHELDVLFSLIQFPISSEELMRIVKKRFFKLTLIKRCVEVLPKKAKKMRLKKLYKSLTETSQYFTFFMSEVTKKSLRGILKDRPEFFKLTHGAVASLIEKLFTGSAMRSCSNGIREPKHVASSLSNNSNHNPAVLQFPGSSSNINYTPKSQQLSAAATVREHPSSSEHNLVQEEQSRITRCESVTCPQAELLCNCFDYSFRERQKIEVDSFHSPSKSSIEREKSIFSCSALDQKCIEFFKRILRNVGFPVSVEEFQKHLLAAPDDMRCYLNARYASSGISCFFEEHADCFNIHTIKLVSLK